MNHNYPTNSQIPYMIQASSLRPSDSPLKLYASAWSAPAWMKTNNALTGFAKLIPEYYQAR